MSLFRIATYPINKYNNFVICTDNYLLKTHVSHNIINISWIKIEFSKMFEFIFKQIQQIEQLQLIYPL